MILLINNTKERYNLLTPIMIIISLNNFKIKIFGSNFDHFLMILMLNYKILRFDWI